MVSLNSVHDLKPTIIINNSLHNNKYTIYLHDMRTVCIFILQISFQQFAKYSLIISTIHIL